MAYPVYLTLAEGTKREMANDLAAINRATDPGIVIDDRLLQRCRSK